MPDPDVTVGRAITRPTAGDRGTGERPGAGVRGMDRPAFVTGKILIVLEATEYANYNDRARVVLSWLRNRDPDLTEAETMEVLQQLRRVGRLGEVLHLIGYPELRQFLLKKRIPWPFIQTHWEPGFEDSSRFLIGYVRGAAESALDGLLFLAYLVRHTVVHLAATVAEKTGILDEATARAIQREPQAFFGALHEFLSDPLIHLAKGVETLIADLEKAFWNLDFLEAGRLFGHFTLMILTLPTAIQSVWKLAKLGVKALQAGIAIARLSFQAFVRTAKVSMAQLASFLDGPRPALATNAGTVLAQSGEDVLVLNSAGEPLGQIKLSEMLEGLQEAAKGSPATSETAMPGSRTRASISSDETPLPGGKVVIKSEGRIGDPPASRPGLEKKYPLGGDVGLPGYARYHIEGIKAIGDELNVVYAPTRFNISQTALIENHIRVWYAEVKASGGELYYEFTAKCRIHKEFEGVSIKVLEEITWKIERRIPGSAEIETVFEFTGRP